MKKLFALIPVVLVLAACGEVTPEERSKVNAILPDGCEIYEVGSYGEIKSLVIVRCSGYDVTTTNGAWTQSHGKTSSTYQFASVIIE